MGTIEVIALVLVAAAALLFLLAARRWYLLRVGAIDVTLRDRPGTGGRGWVLGVGRYGGDELLWFRVFSLALTPSRSVSRRTLEIVGRRRPDGTESWAVAPGSVILECRLDSAPLQLAMGEEALTGFLSWLEAAPPGGYAATGFQSG
ncbi:MAG: DUF2550 domain-containing protein [Actinobacteria bacterium]|nr:DUF2550 domain-containing protein [Actinomycetota bacterium]